MHEHHSLLQGGPGTAMCSLPCTLGTGQAVAGLDVTRVCMSVLPGLHKVLLLLLWPRLTFMPRKKMAATKMWE